MNLKRTKKLLILNLLILLWIPSYGQIISDSILCLKLNEINYFILQDTKAHYFQISDSLTTISYNICQRQLSNDSIIIKNQKTIIDSQLIFIEDQDKLLNSTIIETKNLKDKSKIKTKVIIIETFIIIGIILIQTLL